MNGANGIGIDTSVPAITELAGLGYARIESTKTSFQQLLNDEHNVPTGTNNAVGYHLKGSARPYQGTFSQVSSDGTDSRLMLTSDTSQLFALNNSTGTFFVGGARVLSVGTTPSTNRHQWIEEFGTVTTPSSGSVGVLIPNSGYSGQPYVWLTNAAGAGPGSIPSVIRAASGSSFTVVTYDAIAAGYGASTVFWRSLGTRLLALNVGA